MACTKRDRERMWPWGDEWKGPRKNFHLTLCPDVAWILTRQHHVTIWARNRKNRTRHCRKGYVGSQQFLWGHRQHREEASSLQKLTRVQFMALHRVHPQTPLGMNSGFLQDTVESLEKRRTEPMRGCGVETRASWAMRCEGASAQLLFTFQAFPWWSHKVCHH